LAFGIGASRNSSANDAGTDPKWLIYSGRDVEPGLLNDWLKMSLTGKKSLRLRSEFLPWPRLSEGPRRIQASGATRHSIHNHWLLTRSA
jgi:hypothetical protein